MKKLTISILSLLLAVTMTACSSSTSEEQTEGPAVTETPSTEVVYDYNSVAVSKVEYAAHGTKAVAVASAVVANDVILAAYLDEYQYLNSTDYVGVPNSDQGFGETMLANELVLGSKRVNNDLYSSMMAEKGGSTQTIAVSFDAIEEFVVGKTVAELEEWVAANTETEGADVISGSTLVDSVGYVQAIIESAKLSSELTTTTSDVTFENVTLGKAEYAAHGTKAVAIATVALSGDTIISAYLDEYQYVNSTDYVGVPNSDQGFGEKMLANELVLGSKRVNNDLYSSMMAEKGGSTQTIAVSFDAIEEFVVGKTVAELEEWVAANTEAEGADVVSGSTLTDTVGYVQTIIEAAKTAN